MKIKTYQIIYLISSRIHKCNQKTKILRMFRKIKIMTVNHKVSKNYHNDKEVHVMKKKEKYRNK